MASYRKLPSGNWYAEIMLLSVRDSKGGFPTKGHARAWAEPREDEIRASKGKLKVDRTLLEAMEKYADELPIDRRGRRWDKVRINKLKRELDFIGKLIHEVDETDISSWRDQSLKTLATSTVNREMNVLSAVFTAAVSEWKWCKTNPVRSTKRPKNPEHRDRLTSEAEKQAMLDAFGFVEDMEPRTLGHRVAYAYLLALETAMREGELCSISRNTLFLKERYVRLENTKNGKKRNVSLSTRAVKILSIFPDGLGLTTAQIDTQWRAARARTKGKVVDLTFHDSCHQAITNLAKKLNVLELSRMTGRSIKTLMIYYNETATYIATRLD